MFKLKQTIINNLKTQSNNYELNLKLGLILVNEKKFLEAQSTFKKLIKIDNSRYEGYLNLSNIYSILKKFDNSEIILKKFIKINNYNKDIISSLATLYYNLRNIKKLKILVEQYITVEKNHILYFFNAFLYELENNSTKQEMNLKKTIKTNKLFWLAYEKLFNLYEGTNKLEEFNKLINQAGSLFNDNVKLDYYKALCLFRTKETLLALETITTKGIEDKFIKFNNLIYLINLYDLKSKIYLKLKNYKLSLYFAIKRNTISINSKENKQFDKNILLDIINKYKFYYKNNDVNIKNNPNKNLLYDNLVFLIGFPRSGTTLLDSILRSHSQTQVLEEKPYLINIRHKFFKHNNLEKIASIKDQDIQKLQKEYLNSFNYSKDKIVIDKFPLNLIEIGFIKKIFPNSRFILALRHPIDAILSCVLTSFKINEAMANYENLETSAYFYNEVFSLFNIYKYAFNLNYFTIKYEDVVNNFDKEINKLVNFLGIKYEDSLKNFYVTAQNRQKIKTPSYHQVIKPIYRDSLYRYKNFPETIQIQSIVKKWIKEFNY